MSLTYDFEGLKELRERLMNARRTLNDAIGTIEGDPRIVAEFGKPVNLEEAYHALGKILSVPEGKDVVKWAQTTVRQLESDLEDVTEERDDARNQCKDLEKKLEVGRIDALSAIREKYGISPYVKLEEWINILIQKAGWVMPPPVSSPKCPRCGREVDKAITDFLDAQEDENYGKPIFLCCAGCTTCFRLSRREEGGFDVSLVARSFATQKKED
jgi:hypothetical protein